MCGVWKDTRKGRETDDAKGTDLHVCPISRDSYVYRGQRAPPGRERRSAASDAGLNASWLKLNWCYEGEGQGQDSRVTG